MHTKLISSLALGVALLSCCPPEKAPAQAGAVQNDTDTIAVASYTSRMERLAYPVKALGKVRNEKRATLVFEWPGILQSITVKNGERGSKRPSDQTSNIMNLWRGVYAALLYLLMME